MAKIDTTVVLFYEGSFEILNHVLHGYNNQNYRQFELLLIVTDFSDKILSEVEANKKTFFFQYAL
ncbi:hypothetical protein [Aquimarina agarivorans]|uniref:hypothetical protein n=1 Tax=Aquimarina agarivorans TaxID=980584 RepID=UPI000248E946|nr:hypothetical protein [Aquimarina agarivorans]